MKAAENIELRHQQTLAAALGTGTGAVADRFEVGVALLVVLTTVSEDTPLLVIVDDAQWLDPASADALGFAARRLDADRVVVVVAGRPPFPTALNGVGVCIDSRAVCIARLAQASRRPARGADRQPDGTRCLERHHASGPKRVHLLGRGCQAGDDPTTPHSPDPGGTGGRPASALLLARVQAPRAHRQIGSGVVVAAPAGGGDGQSAGRRRLGAGCPRRR